MKRGAWALPAVLIMNVSCNHLFYHPDDAVHATPAAMSLPYDDLAIKTADGVTLSAWHIKPPAEKRRRVTVVQFHGNAENMTTHFMYVAWLAPLGFDVVTFDYRGYGKSEGTPDRAGTVRDGQAVLHYVKGDAELGSGRVYVLGQSLGGAVSTVAIATDPQLQQAGAIAGLALDSTFASYRGMARGALARPWLTWPLQWPLSFLVTDELSPIDYVGKLTMPVMAWHSKDDPVVPYDQGEKLFAAFTGEKKWVPLTGETHTAAFVDPKSPNRQLLVDFLK